MSDNPGDGELFRLGVEPDDAGFAELGTLIKRLQDQIAEMSGVAARDMMAGSDAAGALHAKLTALANEAFALNSNFRDVSVSVEEGITQFKDLTAQLDAIVAGEKAVADAAQQTTETINAQAQASAGLSGGGAPTLGYSLEQYQKGYGVSGGIPGPAEAESGGVGSAFGIGHAASVAGHALGAPALSEAGAAIYMEEGLRRVGPLLQDLNKYLLDTGGLIPPLTAALAEAEIPMAGLVAAALPLAGVALAAGAAFLLLKNRLDEGKDAVGAAIDRQDQYHKALLKTPQELEDEINKLNDANKQLADQRSQEQVQLGNLYGSNLKGDGSFLGNAQQSAGILLAGLGGTAGGLQESIGKLTAELTKNQTQVDADTDALQKLTGAKVADATRTQAQADIQQQERFDQYDKLNTDAVNAKADALENENFNYFKAIDTIQQMDQSLNLSDVEHAKNKAAIDEYRNAITQNAGDINHLRTTSLEAAQAAQVLADAIKAAKEAAKEAADAYKQITTAADNYEKSVLAASAEHEKSVTDAKRREAQAEEQYTRGSLQDTEARYQISLKEGRDEVKIHQDTADKILDIATKVGQQESDAHTTLARQQEDDQVKFQDSQAKLVRDANNQAAEDAIEHNRRLADIAKQHKNDETAALLNRDFLSLMKDRLKAPDDGSKENASYSDREQKLSRHLQQQETELQIHLQQEEAQQRIAFNRKIEDIQKNAYREIEQQHVAEERKIAVARQAEQQQISDLNHGEAIKIALLRHNLFDIELPLYAAQERERIKIAIATQNEIVTAATATLRLFAKHQSETIGGAGGTQGGAGGIPRFAAGGPFGAGSLFEMSEAGPETLNIGGGSYAIPGAAMVYPLQGGSVTQGGNSSKSINFAPVITISGRGKSDQALVDEIEDRMTTMLERIHGEN